MQSNILTMAHNQSGFSWASIARALGVSEQTLRNWRNFKIRVPDTRWQALSAALGVETLDRAGYLREWSQSRSTAPVAAPVAVSPPRPPVEPQSAPAPAPAPAVGWFKEVFGDE